MGIECFHMTSRRSYWCPKTMKRRPCWCSKPVLWELNSFLMQTLSFVPINLHRCWPREWKHSIAAEVTPVAWIVKTPFYPVTSFPICNIWIFSFAAAWTSTTVFVSLEADSLVICSPCSSSTFPSMAFLWTLIALSGASPVLLHFRPAQAWTLVKAATLLFCWERNLSTRSFSCNFEFIVILLYQKVIKCFHR